MISAALLNLASDMMRREAEAAIRDRWTLWSELYTAANLYPNRHRHLPMIPWGGNFRHWLHNWGGGRLCGFKKASSGHLLGAEYSVLGTVRESELVIRNMRDCVLKGGRYD